MLPENFLLSARVPHKIKGMTLKPGNREIYSIFLLKLNCILPYSRHFVKPRSRLPAFFTKNLYFNIVLNLLKFLLPNDIIYRCVEKTERRIYVRPQKQKEVKDLPNIKSAKKRVLITSVKTLQNKILKTSLKTAIKKYDAALASGDKTASAEAYRAAVKKIDRAVSRGILHKNNAARKKSQFTIKLNSLGA